MAAVGLRVQSMPSPAATALIFDNPAMNARSAASPLSFELKNMHLPLMSVLLKTADLHQLGEDLQKRFGDTPDFFDNDPVLIDLQSLDSQSGPLDMPGLLQLLKRHRMNPVAVRTQVSAHEAAATLAGLFVTQASRPMPASPATAATETVREVIREVEVVREVTSSTPSAMVVDKPLRSGQHVYAKGRDLVVLSMVNPGAEIMADGHIHVYAPLRGRAIAGAKGDTSARIFTLSLEAELVSIAGTYRTSDTALPSEVAGKPAQIWLADERLQMRGL
jgi:septum site-determining protein MinC